MTKVKKAASAKTLKVKLIRSTAGRLPTHKVTVESLGLKRLNQIVEVPDNLPIRGMINKVSYLLKVEEV